MGIGAAGATHLHQLAAADARICEAHQDLAAPGLWHFNSVEDAQGLTAREKDCRLHTVIVPWPRTDRGICIMYIETHGRDRQGSRLNFGRAMG